MNEALRARKAMAAHLVTTRKYRQVGCPYSRRWLRLCVTRATAFRLLTDSYASRLQQQEQRKLVFCNRSSQHNSAPKERHNIAHGVSRGSRYHPSPPTPLPPARERGAEGGVRAFQPRARALG